MLVVVDAGNYSTKFFWEKDGNVAFGCFSSISHEYQPFATDGIIDNPKKLNRIQYAGFDKWVGEDAKDFFALKKQEEIYAGNVRKGHHDAVIRVVLALYKIHESEQKQTDSIQLIVMSPVLSRKKDKTFFAEMLTEYPTANIDGNEFSINIDNVKIAAEGLGAKFFVPQANCVIVDAGSQTTNILHFVGGQFVESYPTTTINAGTQNSKLNVLVDSIMRKLNRVDLDYTIRVSGGKADDVAEKLSQIGFQNCLAVSATVDNFYVNGIGIAHMVLQQRGQSQ